MDYSMNVLRRVFVFGASAVLLAGCKSSTETELNGETGNGSVNGPGYLYAGMVGTGIYRSTNNGLNWTQMDAGLASDTVYSLVGSGSFVFAGTYGAGIFRSSDNGRSTAWRTQAGGCSPASR